MRVLRGEAGFGERASRPGELAGVPAVEARDGDAVLGGVDEPAVAEVDAHVADLRRLRPRTLVAEEDDVGRLEARQSDALRLRHLAAHLVGRAPAENGGERAFVRIRLQLVDAPDEAGAVVPPARGDSELGLRTVARAAPDVGHADARDRRREDL